MAQKNKLLIFGTILIVATIGHSKMLEIKNENTIMFMEENEKEVNDDLFIEFVDGKIAETPDKNIDLVSQTNIKKKKIKLIKINTLLLSKMVMEYWWQIWKNWMKITLLQVKYSS